MVICSTKTITRARFAVNVAIAAGLFALLIPFCSVASPDSAGSAVVTLLDDNVFIRIPVSFASRTMYFIVDTGSSRTSLDRAHISLLGSRADSAHQSTSSGDGQADLYRAPPLAIGSVRVALDTVLANDLTLARQISGVSVDGILGMDVLSNFVVELDFVSGQVSLRKEAPAVDTSANVLKLVTIDGVPVLSLERPAPVSLLVDSAANVSLSLNSSDWNTVLASHDRSRSVHTIFATVDRRVVDTEMTRVDTVRIGRLDYQGLLCTKISGNALSSVGLPFLRRHHVVADFPHQTLYLIRQSTRPEEKDMSGLHLLKLGDDVTVVAVDADSPAAKAGIKPNDVLLRADASDVATLGMNALRKRLRTKDGDRCHLDVRRLGETFSVEMKLRRQI